MELYSVALIFRWLIPLWLAGWLLLPASRRVFPTLPDGGMAAGRLLALMMVSLFAFWGASLHLIPLTYSPIILAVFPFAVFAFFLRHHLHREELFGWIRIKSKTLLISDTIFLLSFLFFVYLRLCQPEIRDQEKPMDSTIIGVLARTIYLPADNPWFSGVPFTNYYYFGHFMAALLTRTFATPLPYAYNLVQPAFCAFFVSILWSLCAALSRSSRAGLLAVSMVAFCGNFEPLRQMAAAWRNHSSLWNLDWWSTSRVVPNTINEYPFFTLALGDAHAHFFGLVLGVLFLSLCYCISTSKIRKAIPAIVLMGITLGVIIMTNPWDAPLYFLLCCSSFIFSTASRDKISLILIYWSFSPVLTSLFFLWNFNSPTHGVDFELWLPPAESLLHWGGFLIGGLFIYFYSLRQWKQLSSRNISLLCVLIIGIIALITPFAFNIRGHFGGDLRHQDTIFKFWLQAWLLIGVAISCGVSIKIFTPHKNPAQLLAKGVLLALWIVPAICSWTVLKHRIKPNAYAGDTARFSLDGARFLPASDRQLITWLQSSALGGAILVEAVGKNPDGSLVGAYSRYGRISFLTGIPTYLGWPQHVGFWGANHHDIQQRAKALTDFYIRNSASTIQKQKTGAAQGASPGNHSPHPFSFPESGPTPLIIWAELENQIFGPPHIGPINDAVFLRPAKNGIPAVYVFKIKE